MVYFIYNSISKVFIIYKQTTMQQTNKQKFISQKLEDNKSFIFGKKNKEQRLLLNPKYADANPIYRILKVQRNTSSILSFILRAGQTKQNTPFTKVRAKSQIRQQLSHKKSYLFRKSKSTRNLQQFKERASKILIGTKIMGEDLNGSKRRIKILDKFNKRVDKYCSYLPENPQEQQQNQSNIANDQLVQLCNQTFFPTEDLHKRAHSLIHYTQPRIPNTRLRKLKARYKMISTIATTTEIQIGRRVLKTQPQQ